MAIYTIPRREDAKILNVFAEIAQILQAKQIQTHTMSGVVNNISSNDEKFDFGIFSKSNSFILHKIEIRNADFTITYQRGGTSVSDPSPFTDSVSVEINKNYSPEHNNNQPKIDNSIRTKVDLLISKRLASFDATKMVGSIASKEKEELLLLHEAMQRRLEELNCRLLEDQNTYRRKLDEQYAEKVDKNLDEFAVKKAEINAEYEERKAELDREKNELEERKKALDDSDNTTARRKIRDSMLAEVKERVMAFGVSPLTQAKRWPVLFGIGLLGCTFFAMLVWTGYELSLAHKEYFSLLEGMRNISSAGVPVLKSTGMDAATIAKVSAADADKSQTYWLWLRFSLYSLGLVGTVLYYIRWQNRWAEQHITSEFQLRQFELDISRANWVVESCLEWRKETNGSAIPSELLSSLTKNLFTDAVNEPKQVVHPADALASALLGSASKLKLKVGDNELEFNPSKISKKPAQATQSD